MEKCLGWARICRKDWPIFVSVVVGFLNTEVATPFILKGILGLNGRSLGVAAGMWASTELCWWIYFSGWLYKNKIRRLTTVNEAIDLGKAIKEFDWKEFLLPKKGDPYFIAKTKNFIKKHSIDNFDPENYKNNRFFDSLIGVLKGFGYIFTCGFIFVMGFLPLWWVFALMVCRLLKWRLAYLILFASNFLKNYFLAFIYEKIGFWWWIALFALSVFAMSYVFKVIVKNLKQVNENRQ